MDKVKKGLEVALVVLVVLLVVIGLIIGFNRLKGDEDEDGKWMNLHLLVNVRLRKSRLSR